jgi:hypothetical protein
MFAHAILRLALTAVISGLLASLAFGYSGGSGTATNPYRIASKADLLALAATPTDYGMNFILTADIDLAGEVFTSAVIAPDTQFTGTFDGSGHVISNLTINQPTKDSIGLFGYVRSGGQVKNLGVINASITGRGYVGGLVGENSYGTVISCYSTGSVSGTGSGVGGLVGQNFYGTVSSCYATGSVSGLNYVGGLVGQNSYGTVSSCYSTGSVIGSVNVGGLEGENGGGTLSSCYSTGSVSGSNNVGGLLGHRSAGTVSSCFWDTQTSGKTVGVGYGPTTGITGKSTAEMKTLSTFTDAGLDFVGETVNGTNDYWYMPAGSYPLLESLPCGYSGGSGVPADPYQIASKADLLVLAAKRSDCGMSFILTADIDLAGEVFTTAAVIAASDIHGTVFKGTFDGNGHVISNLTIAASTADYVGLFGVVASGGQVKNLGVVNANITGGTSVGGLVGANRGTITSCYSSGPVSGSQLVGGLVGCSDQGTVTSCYSTGSVSGTGSSVGGLVGTTDGTVSSCYSTGSVSGGSEVGGLVGTTDGTVSSCYSTGSVSGSQRVGGLAGHNDGTVSSCYSTGSVTGGNGSNYVGGLVGWNSSGTVSSCYSSGTASGGSYVGGLVGYNKEGSVVGSCYSTGSVSGTGNCVGGLVGYNDQGTLVSSCYSTSSVSGSSGSDSVGGLVGWNLGGVASCYSTGSVSGSDYVGGLVGMNLGCIVSCYSTGSVSGTGYHVGGLVGYNGGTLASCFWDVQASGMTVAVGNGSSDGATGKSTAEMKTLSTFTDAGLDFVGETVNGTNDYWYMPAGSYPLLVFAKPAGDMNLDGRVDNADLMLMGEQWLGAPGVPSADIAPEPDGVVNFRDFAILANQWGLGA